MLGSRSFVDWIKGDWSGGQVPSIVRLWVERLRDSFWFVPSLFVAAAVVAGLLTPVIDRWVSTDGPDGPSSPFFFAFNAGAGGARAMLGAIAGSSISVAATVFSITLATLALTSGQFGPRLLRTFVSDRGIQVSMGTFLAAFVYPLLLLRTVRTAAEDGFGFVPNLGVTLSILLGLASVGVLIYFVHHLAVLIRAPKVIEMVGIELDDAIDTNIDREPVGVTEERQLPEAPGRESRSIVSRAGRAGYVAFIDYDSLISVADDHEALLWTVVRPGDFVFEQTPLVVCQQMEEGDFGEDERKQIANAVRIGNRRTLSGDVSFGVNQLTEIAQRALSPGINDPFTACNCIERLGASLSRAGGRAMPQRVGKDLHGKLRVVLQQPTWQDLIETAFDPIRRYGRGDAEVMKTLLDTLRRLLDACPPHRHETLKTQADAALAACESGDLDQRDVSIVRHAHERFRERLGDC